jgi:hypothetical protein
MSTGTNSSATGQMQQASSIAQRINDANAANVQTVQAHVKPDATYAREWRRFKEFVDAERAADNIPSGEKYLTRENVDLYFSEKISKRNVNPDGARRVVSALQWFSDRYEHAFDAFKVESPYVIRALAAHKQHHGASLATKIVDPHGKLPTDVMTDDEYMKAHDIILKSQEWQDLQLAWSTCDQTYVRYSSFAKLELSDIRADFAHGPPKDTGPGNKGMISLVLRPGGTHKDRFKYTKVVGGWRHLNYIRCSTGALAMNLMVRFHEDPKLVNMTFYKDADGSAKWWTESLRMNWNATNKAAETAYKVIYNKAGIKWCKCLHLRKAGMDKAGTAGVSEDAVSTMSKHNADKIRRYMPELHAEVMKVMAGFQTDEEYYVPRTLLEMPWTPLEMTRAVFPRYDQWVAQQQSPFGDNSMAASNFLYQTLPFLALVALQDGIYWIRDYPNNSASRMLRNTFPNYERWASEARKEIRKQQADLEESRISRMETGAQASYHVLYREVQNVKAALLEDSKEKHEENRQMIRELQRQNNERQWYGHSQQQHLQDQSPAVAMAEQRGFVPLAPRTAPVHRNPIQVSAQGNALEELRPTERVPNIPSQLPNSMLTVLIQHQQNELSSFEVPSKKHWPQSLRLRFSKRLYLYKILRQRATRQQGSSEDERMRNAALAMDQEKGASTSMNDYLKELKSRDPSIKSRAKRNRDAV